MTHSRPTHRTQNFRRACSVVTISTLAMLFSCRDSKPPLKEDPHDETHAHEKHDEHDEHDDEKPQTVTLSPAAIKRNAIQVSEVTEEHLIGGIDIPAEVELDPDRTAHIASLVSGQIATTAVTLGDTVKKNQELATLRSVSLGEARAMVSQARAAVDLANSNFQRQEQLQREGIGSGRSFLEAQGDLKRSQAELSLATERMRLLGGSKGMGSTITIRTPIEGVVIERHATPGEVVAADQRLFIVADLSHVWIVGRAYEKDVAIARTGISAGVTLQAYPDRFWKGTVSYVGNTLDPHSRTLPIRVELKNAEGLLRPGLFGTISLTPHRAANKPVLTVPAQAIQRLGPKTVVFVQTQKDTFRATDVAIGASSHGKVEIKSGLQLSDRVVTQSAFVLKSELERNQLGDGEHHH